MIENRKAVRVDAEGVCSVIDSIENTVSSAALKDISISGVGFFSYEQFKPNQLLKLKFELDGQWIELEGLIMFAGYKENAISRYGFEINNIDEQSYRILNEYVTKKMKASWNKKMSKYSKIKI